MRFGDGAVFVGLAVVTTMGVPGGFVETTTVGGVDVARGTAVGAIIGNVVTIDATGAVDVSVGRVCSNLMQVEVAKLNVPAQVSSSWMLPSPST